MSGGTRNVLMVCYYYPPLGGIGSIRASKFVRYLPQFGWRPIVLTPREGAYHRDPDLSVPGAWVVRTPSLEISRFGKRVLGTGASDTEPARVGAFSARIRRLVRTWLYHPDAQIGWYPFAVQAGRKLLRDVKVDAVFSTSVPLTAHLVASRLAGEAGIPWVAEFRDYWTDLLPLDHPRRRAHLRLEKRFLREARSVVTISPSLERLYRDKGARQVEVITNGFDPEDIPAASPPADFVLSYSGSFYPSIQDVGVVWSALADLRATGEIPTPRVRLVGEMHPLMQVALERAGLADIVEVTGFRPYRAAVALLASSSVLLAAGPRDSRRELQGMMPAKVFDYLGTGLPILLVAEPTSDVALLLGEQAGCHVVAPGDVAAARRGLLAASTAARVPRGPSPFNRRALAGQLARLLDRTCQPLS